MIQRKKTKDMLKQVVYEKSLGFTRLCRENDLGAVFPKNILHLWRADDMVQYDFETCVFSSNQQMRDKLCHLMDNVGFNPDYVVTSCQELRQKLKEDTYTIIVYDMVGCSNAEKSDFCRILKGNRKYYCICIRTEEQTGFLYGNTRYLDEGFEKVEFNVEFFDQIINLIHINNRKSYGCISYERIDKYVGESLVRLGIAFTSKGYEYMKYAIVEVIFDSSKGVLITKTLLHDVAKAMNTSVYSVEHAMRTQLHDAYNNSEYRIKIDKLFKEKLPRDGAPTISEFIPWVAELIRNELDRLNNRSTDDSRALRSDCEFRFDPALGGGYYKETTIDDINRD